MKLLPVTFICLLLIILQGCISNLLLVNTNKTRLNRVQLEWNIVFAEISVWRPQQFFKWGNWIIGAKGWEARSKCSNITYILRGKMVSLKVMIPQIWKLRTFLQIWDEFSCPFSIMPLPDAEASCSFQESSMSRNVFQLVTADCYHLCPKREPCPLTLQLFEVAGEPGKPMQQCLATAPTPLGTARSLWQG